MLDSLKESKKSLCCTNERANFFFVCITIRQLQYWFIPIIRTLCMLDNFATTSTTTTKRLMPSGCLLKSEVCEARKKRTTGTTVKNFRVAVNCTPSSICSQKVMLHNFDGKKPGWERSEALLEKTN